VLTAHTRLAERLVEEDQATLADRFDERAEGFAPLAMLRGVALDRDEGLFFREYPRRWSARQTDEPLVCTCALSMRLSVSSSIVASGRSRTSVRSVSSTSPRRGEKLPPPRGNGGDRAGLAMAPQHTAHRRFADRQ
jgi:hypothetical protein